MTDLVGEIRLRKPRQRRPIADRFWEKVDRSGQCWLWRGSLMSNGYGCFQIDHRTNAAHRVAYELTNGPIAQGLFVCHSCDVRRRSRGGESQNSLARAFGVSQAAIWKVIHGKNRRIAGEHASEGHPCTDN